MFGSSFENTCAESPNDPKLSDGGGLAQPVPDAITNENCPESDSAPLAEAQAVTARSRSLQRMVRRCDDSVETPKPVETKRVRTCCGGWQDVPVAPIKKRTCCS